MSYKLYFGVDVSKLWLDIAYYDGVDVDWKHGHIRVDNDEKGSPSWEGGWTDWVWAKAPAFSVWSTRAYTVRSSVSGWSA